MSRPFANGAPGRDCKNALFARFYLHLLRSPALALRNFGAAAFPRCAEQCWLVEP